MVTKSGLHTQRAVTVSCSPLSLSNLESESSVTMPIKPATANDITGSEFVTHSTLKKINHVISDKH